MRKVRPHGFTQARVRLLENTFHRAGFRRMHDFPPVVRLPLPQDIPVATWEASLGHTIDMDPYRTANFRYAGGAQKTFSMGMLMEVERDQLTEIVKHEARRLVLDADQDLVMGIGLWAMTPAEPKNEIFAVQMNFARYLLEGLD